MTAYAPRPEDYIGSDEWAAGNAGTADVAGITISSAGGGSIPYGIVSDALAAQEAAAEAVLLGRISIILAVASLVINALVVFA